MLGRLKDAPADASENVASPLCANMPNKKMSISPNAMNVPAAMARRLAAAGARIAVPSVVTRSTPWVRPRTRRPRPGGAGTSPG